MMTNSRSLNKQCTNVNNKKHIKIDGQVLSSTSGDSVLETLEAANIKTHFNCREGFCGVCRTKLLAGQVEYTLDPLAFIDDDEILACCTVPISDIEIKVEF